MLQASQTVFPTWAEISPSFRIPRREATVLLHGEPQIVTTLSGPYAEERQELEAFVRDVFRRAYGADIKHFMPQLMSLRDGQGQLLAVCGLRHADESPLFLEAYLNEPIEQMLSKTTGEQVARKDIIEVGNLAVANRSNIRSLLSSVSLYLHGTSTQWAVFTGIPTLRNSLAKLNIPLEVLANAELKALPENEHADWGSYYDENPQVMAVRRKG
ncbi:MAG: thermostable hemolysin [Candidatus Methylopumilus sp.]|jgi:hypothetical protein